MLIISSLIPVAIADHNSSDLENARVKNLKVSSQTFAKLNISLLILATEAISIFIKT